MGQELVSFMGNIVVGVLSLIGVIITNNRANNKIQNDIKTQQAVTDEKIKELTREVRYHNGFAERIPVLDVKVEDIERRVKTLESFHRSN